MTRLLSYSSGGKLYTFMLPHLGEGGRSPLHSIELTNTIQVNGSILRVITMRWRANALCNQVVYARLGTKYLPAFSFVLLGIAGAAF